MKEKNGGQALNPHQKQTHTLKSKTEEQGPGRFNLDATPLGGRKRRTSIEKEIIRGGETPLNGYEVIRVEATVVL
ncbi:hypothetical protein PFLUV_G00087710 [Perca fluviatilis]|uniref:Uncharacterized protein n=1 Tax=Perca fluviatilis TaxID=8168 RepID=A0A6A5F889_PERFL|nr:hypothetical protein PFLUV_G00087710 [Perca fluviatilis]